MILPMPVLGVCGWSGSGKTTLIERLVPELDRQGLAVAVIKHDAHGIDVDRPGKDSDRFFRAGADVLLQGPGESCLRNHCQDDEWLCDLRALADRYDLILVEGHKSTPLPKIWLLGEQEDSPPPEAENVIAVLDHSTDRLSDATDIVHRQLNERWERTPLWGCILIGGQNRRMGRPKHLLTRDGKTWLTATADRLGEVCEQVVISGAGEVPTALARHARLPDVPDIDGPMAGVLAAIRWTSYTSWLMAACDQPELTADALGWLLSARAPGVWAVLGKLPGAAGPEPLPGWYNFSCGPVFERLALQHDYRLRAVANHPKVKVLDVPVDLAPAWRNINTPAELRDRPREQM